METEFVYFIASPKTWFVQQRAGWLLNGKCRLVKRSGRRYWQVEVHRGDGSVSTYSTKCQDKANAKLWIREQVQFDRMKSTRIVKIGKSRSRQSVCKRISQISGFMPFRPVLLGLTNLHSESALHQAFHRNRLNGEWFELVEGIERYMERNCNLFYMERDGEFVHSTFYIEG